MHAGVLDSHLAGELLINSCCVCINKCHSAFFLLLMCYRFLQRLNQDSITTFPMSTSEKKRKQSRVVFIQPPTGDFVCLSLLNEGDVRNWHVQVYSFIIRRDKE